MEGDLPVVAGATSVHPAEATGTGAGARSDAGPCPDPVAALAQYRKVCDRLSTMARIGVWECDLATEHLTWTDGVYDLFDLPRGAPLDRSAIVRLYDEQSRVEMEEARARAVRDGTGFDLDVLVHTALGNARWIRLTADVEQEGGRSVRLFGTKQDVTNERAAQARIDRLQTELIHLSRQNAMGVMAGTLAHELNQPLTAITNYAAAARRLIEAAPAAPAASAVLSEIEANALRAGGIIRRMRDIALHGQRRKDRLDLDRLLRAAAAYASTGFEDVAFEFDLQASGVVLADGIEIEQVLINLVRNACEAMEHMARRSITMSTSDGDGVVVISVADSGPGLPDELDLFAATPSPKRNGMGIGLSICRTMIEANGGRIWMERPARGARVAFTLPTDKPNTA